MEKQKTGREIAVQTLHAYKAALQRSNDLIAQYEAIENIEEPSSSQLARLKELEEILIPEAVAKDKKIKEKVDELLLLPGEALSYTQLQILEMRWLASMEWDDITTAMHGKKEDFLKKFEYYKNRVFKLHGRGLDAIGAALDRKMQSPAE